MKAVVQRVSSARVRVGVRTVGVIGDGLLVLVGVGRGDGPEDVQYVADKIRHLRIFEDSGDGGPATAGGLSPGRRHMSRSVADIDGAVLVVPQFTLYGDCRKGRRPSFDAAAPPEVARALYDDLVAALSASGLPVATGEFQADMQVELVNSGPVTLLLDSRRAP